MMHTMYGSGAASGLFILHGLHMVAALAFSLGIIFLIVWAVKTLSTAQLKTWGIALAVVGFLLCALTLPAGMAGKRGMMMKHSMSGDDGMEMSMMEMSEMLDGKTGDDFDAAFIAGMIPHHQGAIDMANAALKDAKHEEIRQVAGEIISAQRTEIEQMKKWQSAWGYTE